MVGSKNIFDTNLILDGDPDSLKPLSGYISGAMHKNILSDYFLNSAKTLIFSNLFQPFVIKFMIIIFYKSNQKPTSMKDHQKF